jgi:hypothetical protein
MSVCWRTIASRSRRRSVCARSSPDWIRFALLREIRAAQAELAAPGAEPTAEMDDLTPFIAGLARA